MASLGSASTRRTTSAILGATFVGMQAFEWSKLIEEGVRPWGNPMGAAQFGASFFMITGFLFWSRLLAQGRNHDWLAFGVSRVFRLYPLYLPLMLLVFVSIFHLQDWQMKEPGLELFKQILAWLTFDRPDINQYRHSGMLISNVTWTLAYEVFFYMALPLAGLVFIYRGSWLQVVLCLIGIYTLYQVVGWEHSVAAHNCAGVAPSAPTAAIAAQSAMPGNCHSAGNSIAPAMAAATDWFDPFPPGPSTKE